MSKVSAVSLSKPYVQESIDEGLSSAIQDSQLDATLKNLPPGSRILVKPNVGADMPSELGVTTDPRVVLALAKRLSAGGLIPVIAESSSVGVDTELALSHEYGVVTDAGFAVTPLDGTGVIACGREWLQMYDIIASCAAVISVPKLKTHDQTVVSLGLKNLKGLLPDATKMEAHKRGLDTSIVDVYESLQRVLGIRVFSVLDALIGLEGLGPVYGNRVDVGILACSDDALAVDAFGCWLMGIDAIDIGHLALANAGGLGSLAFTLSCPSGHTLTPMRFRRASEELAALSLDGVDLVMDRACTSCKNTILAVIAERRYWDKEMPKITLVAGASECKGVKRCIIVGNCAARSVFTRDISVCKIVEGCPPASDELAEAIDAADRCM